MLLARGAAGFLFTAVQPNLAESDATSENSKTIDSQQTIDELDLEFFAVFLSTIDEVEEEYITQSDYV